MTKQTSKIIALAALVGLVVQLTGCQSVKCCQKNADSNRSHSAICAPDYTLGDQVAREHASVTFSFGVKFDPSYSHRWFFNGYPIDSNNAPILGVTDYASSDLTITDARLINCGFYNYQGEKELGGRKINRVASNPAQLLLSQAGTNSLQTFIVVYGTPCAGSGNSGKSCPGAYTGYVSYAGPWYFRNGGTAVDGTGATDTKVVYYGVPFSNMGCGPNVPPSPYPYHFTIFFKNTVPTGSYPLKLTMN